MNSVQHGRSGGANVLIVGGGIAGASLGARLAGPMRVTLIEAEDLCGRHATGRSAAFWVASLGSASGRRLSIASKPMFDVGWPGSTTPLLRRRGTVHLTGAHGDLVEDAEDLTGEHALTWLDRAELDRMVPGLREQWTGAWYEPSCADIEVAAFHAACLAAIRRQGGEVRTDSALRSAKRAGDGWEVETAAGPIHAGILVNAAGAWADDVAQRCGVPKIGLQPMRRTVVQLRVGRGGLKDLPLVTDLHHSFYFKGEGTSSIWVSPLDETPVDPCDAAPEELDVATAIDRFERAVDWPVEVVERKWAGLRTFAPDRLLKLGFDPRAPGFFWCAGQGGMGIQTAPAASLLCAALIRGEAMPDELAGIDPADFQPR
ncbi:MAG TPA: FAD-binding oxidoreductase [Sphingomicrobium sp.]|nr:FAD-binding oxidoreductase [Sphingomicrobium sp.]